MKGSQRATLAIGYAALFMGWLLSTASIVADEGRLYAPPRTERAQLLRPELYRIAIENQVSGSILLSRDQGKTWLPLGRVIVPIDRVVHLMWDFEFTASDWGYVGAVTATAVNAIHVKVAHPSKHAAVFSILPKEFQDEKPVSTSYKDSPSTLFTDIPGGKGLFGGEASLRLGDPLYLATTVNGTLDPWPDYYAPAIGDVLVFIAQRAPVPTWSIEFDNIVGGEVRFYRGDDTPVVLGRVLQRISGSGRFLGGIFENGGRIRANHPGVIDVKTAPPGQLGGFQIVPEVHAHSENLAYIKGSPVYMVLAPVEGLYKPLEGEMPLFSGFIRPGDLVEAKVNGEWGPMPLSVGKDFTGLKHVEAFRIRPATDRVAELASP
jgi:hypothetical protein